jgi:hypothetical protein
MNAKRKLGRPVKMTPLCIETIFAAIAAGANVTQACTLAGVHPSTYCKWAIRAGRRSYPRPKLPTLWAKGITRRDRLFLWYLAYRLPAGYTLTPELLREACENCRYPHSRLLDVQQDYPQAWGRMLIKRAHRLAGVKDSQATEQRIEAARRADTVCRHPRIARAIGCPFRGFIYSKPLRARTSGTIQEALQPPASVDPVTEIVENLGLSADVTIDEMERSEIAQPEWLRDFISRPGWVHSDDQESSW